MNSTASTENKGCGRERVYVHGTAWGSACGASRDSARPLKILSDVPRSACGLDLSRVASSREMRASRIARITSWLIRRWKSEGERGRSPAVGTGSRVVAQPKPSPPIFLSDQTARSDAAEIRDDAIASLLSPLRLTRAATPAALALAILNEAERLVLAAPRIREFPITRAVEQWGATREQSAAGREGEGSAEPKDSRRIGSGAGERGEHFVWDNESSRMRSDSFYYQTVRSKFIASSAASAQLKLIAASRCA